MIDALEALPDVQFHIVPDLAIFQPSPDRPGSFERPAPLDGCVLVLSNPPEERLHGFDSDIVI